MVTVIGLPGYFFVALSVACGPVRPSGEGRWPIGQNVVMTTPTTSAWAAIASIELVTVSNIRMGLVSDAGMISGIGDLGSAPVSRN